MNIVYAIVAVLAVAAVGAVAGGTLAVAVPYVALVIFLAGFCYRVARWAQTPVPFRIVTSCGQQKTLPFLKHAKLDNPASGLGAVGRMALEVLAFRSLFRNSRMRMDGQRLVFGENKWLWLGAIAFHWSLLLILLRHLRLLIEPVPRFVALLESVDGFFQVSNPRLYLSDIVVVCALAYLLLRRLKDPQVRFISLFSDYFALFLLLGIAVSGVLMRYVTRVDVLSVKQFALGLATFHPVSPANLGAMFYVHLLLICTLAAYFPFSKLMHMGGVFLSPTRNLANNNRRKRHVNPWNYPVPTHTFAEWQEEFHDKIVACGLPLDAEAKNVRSASAH